MQLFKAAQQAGFGVIGIEFRYYMLSRSFTGHFWTADDRDYFFGKRRMDMDSGRRPVLFLSQDKTDRRVRSHLPGPGIFDWECVLKEPDRRSRPCWLDETIPVLVQVPRDYSFPSGHTLSSLRER